MTNVINHIIFTFIFIIDSISIASAIAIMYVL